MLPGYKKPSSPQIESYRHNDRKMRIVRHIKTNSGSMNSKMSSSKNSIYSTTNHNDSNNKVIVNLVLSKVDLSAIRRSMSNPYIKKKQTQLFTNFTDRYQQIPQKKKLQIQMTRSPAQESKQQNGELEILSPRKNGKMTAQLVQQIKNKSLTTRKEKVVIFSSVNLNPQMEITSKKVLKAKVSQKTVASITKKTTNALPGLQNPKPTIFMKQKQQNSEIGLFRITSQQSKTLTIEQMIRTDVQILKLFPKIDLQVLVHKIKKQQQQRKEKSIERWQNFNYNFNSQCK